MTNDKQRERLVALINEAERESLNYEMANKFYPFDNYKSRSEFVADYLLEHGVIVPPCKIGDIVWCNIEGFDRPLKGMIRRVSVSKDFTTIATGVEGYFAQDYLINDFGKKVFYTKEEAEQALNNIQNGNSCEGDAE